MTEAQRAADADDTEQVERGELIESPPEQEEERPEQESVQEPGRVMRIGAMIRQLLEEVRTAELDEAGRDRLREIYDQSVQELSGALSPDLSEELARLASPFGDTPASVGELRIAQAQLVGWLEGLFHGIQTAMVAQQMAAQVQQQMRGRALTSGGGPEGPVPGAGTGAGPTSGTGQYL